MNLRFQELLKTRDYRTEDHRPGKKTSASQRQETAVSLTVVGFSHRRARQVIELSHVRYRRRSKTGGVDERIVKLAQPHFSGGPQTQAAHPKWPNRTDAGLSPKLCIVLPLRSGQSPGRRGREELRTHERIPRHHCSRLIQGKRRTAHPVAPVIGWLIPRSCGAATMTLNSSPTTCGRPNALGQSAIRASLSTRFRHLK